MTKKSEAHGVDLTFRPSSYFWPMGLETHLLATIKGAERKAALQRLIDAGEVDDIPEFLSQSALSDEERSTVGRIHPAFMGGEYLPNLGQHEVEIARITIASTTQDVTSVYARRGRNRIHYRVVDEYEGDTLAGKATRTSRRPLTLGKLETFFTSTWSIFDVLEMNFGDEGYDVGPMLSFVVSVESPFYPEIGRLYRHRIEAWAAEKRRECGLDEPDDGPLEAPAPRSHAFD